MIILYERGIRVSYQIKKKERKGGQKEKKNPPFPSIPEIMFHLFF